MEWRDRWMQIDPKDKVLKKISQSFGKNQKIKKSRKKKIKKSQKKNQKKARKRSKNDEKFKNHKKTNKSH